MFKSSITRFLITSLGILMTGLFIAALILAYQAWTNYQLAGRIARLTTTDKTLFQALVTVRAQIPKNSTALIAEGDPRAVISATHAEASRTVRSALEALKATEIANRDQLVAAIQTAWQRVDALQFTVDTQASLAQTERNLLNIDDWRTAVHGLTYALNTASVVVGNGVRIGNPLVAEMVQIRRSAWTIRRWSKPSWMTRSVLTCAISRRKDAANPNQSVLCPMLDPFLKMTVLTAPSRAASSESSVR